MTDSASTPAPIALNPSLIRYLSTARGPLRRPYIWLLAGGAMFKFVIYAGDAPLDTAFVAFMLLALAGMVVPYMTLPRIVLQGNELHWRKLLARGVFSLDEIGDVRIDARHGYPGLGEAVITVLDGDGRCLLRVFTAYWSQEALKELLDFLYRRVEVA